MSRRATSHYNPGFPVEDTAAMEINFANRMLGTFLLLDTYSSWSRSSEQTHRRTRATPHTPTRTATTSPARQAPSSIPTMRLKISRRKRSWWEKTVDSSTEKMDRSDPLVNQVSNSQRSSAASCIRFAKKRGAVKTLKVVHLMVLNPLERDAGFTS